MTKRTVFFVSDGTGITAESLGHSLLSQFEGVEWVQYRLPFINSREKALEAVQRIEARPLQEQVAVKEFQPAA